MLLCVSICLMYVFILQKIAFTTLWERHILGKTQRRIGPNKVSFKGVLQPLLDGLKLLKKESIVPLGVRKIVFYLSPIFSFKLMGLEWLLVPYLGNFITFSYGYLFLTIVLGCKVYPIMLTGINRRRKFALLGAFRASAAAVSFEVVFFLMLVGLIFYSRGLELRALNNWYLMSWCILFLIKILVEIHRAPFDFAEGESELVSGFNVEYSRVYFVLFFLGEYGRLIFFRFIVSLFYFNKSLFMSLLIKSLLLFVRSCYPRVRFDTKMAIYWFVILPVTVNFVFISFVLGF